MRVVIPELRVMSFIIPYTKKEILPQHFDQFQSNSSRKYSMISYLNEQWKAADGGELLIHQLNNNQIITPTQQDRFF
jgi:SM-20-related protein